MCIRLYVYASLLCVTVSDGQMQQQSKEKVVFEQCKRKRFFKDKRCGFMGQR